jgi:hypothetical protein
MENRSMTYLNNGRWMYTIDITALEWKDQISFHFLTKDILGYTSINNNFSNLYTIKIHDFQAPIITIHSPTIDESFTNIAPEFNISIIEEDLVSIWYTVEGSIIQFPIIGLTGTIDQDVWNNIPQGEVTITFYAQDTEGNIGTESVVVTKSIPSAPVISGYNVFLLIGVISIVSAILLERQKHYLKKKKR